MNEKDYEVLTAAELDELSDGYEADEDITIPYVETRKTPLDGIFPDKYQIPDKYLTPVKRQFTSNCWTYAATCSLETFLLSHGKIPSNTDIYAVFSEAHFTYDMFDLDASGMKKISAENCRTRLPPRKKSPVMAETEPWPLLTMAEEAGLWPTLQILLSPRPVS